jgi:hypothetical protein
MKTIVFKISAETDKDGDVKTTISCDVGRTIEDLAEAIEAAIKGLNKSVINKLKTEGKEVTEDNFREAFKTLKIKDLT